MRAATFFALLLAVVAVSSVEISNTYSGEASLSNVRCGYVYDGDSIVYDIDYQNSRTVITSNWFGFDIYSNPILRYEWAVVSEDMATDSFFVPSKVRCRSIDDLDAQPDVMDWTSVDTSTSTTASYLNLEIGKKYFVLVKAVYSSGDSLITNSDGVTVVEPQSSIEGTEEEANVEEAVSSQRVARDVEAVEETLETEQIACPADPNCKHCQIELKGVGGFLTDLYGPPIYVRDPRADVRVAVLISYQSDSHSGLSAGVIVAIVLVCIILLLLLCLPGLRGSKKTNKFQTNPHRTENIENI